MGSGPARCLPVLLSVGAFAVDLVTPDGVVDGLLYIAPVLGCLWVPAVNSALYTALGLMLPMSLGAVLSPSGAPLSVAIGNRCAAAAVLWLAAYAVWRNARSARARESSLSLLSERLRAVESAVGEERAVLSDWLHRDISAELDILTFAARR